MSDLPARPLTMQPPQSSRPSLSTRLLLGVQIAFLTSVWTLTWVASSSLRATAERELNAHQQQRLESFARELQSGMDERIAAMRLVASEITPSMLADRNALQQLLAQRPLLTQYFNAGVGISDGRGTLLAANPNSPANAESHLLARSAVQSTLNSNAVHVQANKRSTSPDGAPGITLAVPLASYHGQAAGVLAGSVRLDQPNFITAIVEAHSHSGARIAIVDPVQQIHIAGTDLWPAQALAPTQPHPPPPDTASPAERLISTRLGLTTPRWELIETYPPALASAPVQSALFQLYGLAALLSVLSLALGIPWLKRQLRPLHDTAVALRDMGSERQTQQALPVPAQAEIAELVTGFNHLLGTLSERENLLRDLFNTSSVGILLVDTQTRLIQANPHMCELFGYPLDELLQMQYADLIAQSEREVGRQRTLALLQGQFETVDIDRQFLRKDGSVFWGRLTGRRMFGPDGKLRGLVGAITDVTERTLLQRFDNFRSRTLEMLARDEALDTILLQTVRGIEDILPQSICSCTLLTADGKALGTTFGPSLPKFYLDALHMLPIGPDAGSCGASAYLGQRVVVDNIANHPNWAPYRELATRAGLGACWSQPIIGADGHVLGSFAVYHTRSHTPSDIDIVLIEQSARLAAIAIERSAVAQRLRDSEEHFRLLTEGVSDVVWRQDANNVFTYISPADERMRGFAASEVVGRHVFDQLTPESQETVRDSLKIRREQREGEPEADTRTLVLEQLCKNGGTVWTEVVSTAERDADGRITGFRGISRDISTRRNYEARLHLAASVMTFAQEGIMITAPDGHILDVNQAFTDITGYARDEVIGASAELLNSGQHDTAYYRSIIESLRSSGRWQGDMWNRRKDGTVYAHRGTISAVCDERGQVQHYVSLFSDITALKLQQQRLEHSAHFDALTELPNRVLMMDRLQQAMVQAQRREQPLALAFLDLDGFKAVNDQHGHAVGDALLQALAARMRAALRDGDTLARLGGDEFVAILVDLQGPSGVVPLLERLLQAVAQPVQLAGCQVQVSASIGVAFYPQDTDIDAPTLLRQADQAMYQAKLAGKNRFHRFGDAVHTAHADQ